MTSGQNGLDVLVTLPDEDEMTMRIGGMAFGDDAKAFLVLLSRYAGRKRNVWPGGGEHSLYVLRRGEAH